jgi:hypothetical protein
MPFQVNYLQELAASIQIELNNASPVLEKYQLTPYDIDELDWTGYYFWAELGYENKDVEEYYAWAAERGRTEKTLSELVQSEDGQQLWRREGFAWIGNFYLADSHACMIYLKRHLRRKGIDFEL